MSEKPEQSDSEGQLDRSDFDRARARECFKRAQELVDRKNYDYAMEWYLTGLDQWPQAADDTGVATLLRQIRAGVGENKRMLLNGRLSHG